MNQYPPVQNVNNYQQNKITYNNQPFIKPAIQFIKPLPKQQTYTKPINQQTYTKPINQQPFPSINTTTTNQPVFTQQVTQKQ